MDIRNPQVLTRPQAVARRLKRLTPLAFYTSSSTRRMGTCQFEELDLNPEKPLLVNTTTNILSRESSYNSLRIADTKYRRYANLGLWWTTAIVGLPILGFTAAILAIILIHRLPHSTTHPFGALANTSIDDASIIVNFSATRLTFIASWSSTLAPMLLGSLMALWHIPTACTLATAAAWANPQDLPTPHQLSMLIGLASGSLDELRKYFIYRFGKVKAKQPQILTRSVWILIISTLLAFAIFCADTAIHAFTVTVPFNRVELQHLSSSAFGRGLISQCTNFDRSTNQGLPCTVIADTSVGANIIARNSGEIISLQHNVSNDNSIWTVRDENLAHGDLLVLMPQLNNVPSDMDYQATTIGVSTQCVPSTMRCHVRMSAGSSPETSYLVFNCTENFRGVLGADPSISNDTIDWTHTDTTTPDFNYKYDRNFQYAYFSDPQLNTIYNSIGGNTINDGASSELALPDNKLINPVFLATAGFIPLQNGPAGERLNEDTEVFSVAGALVGYTLNCSVTSYDVSYSWINRTMDSLNYTATSNGSIIELAHGMQATGMPALSQAQSLASLSDTAAGLARSFANQHSVNSLTLIGSVMSPRSNTAEAVRENLLVTKMSTGALGFLVGSNLVYVIFGLALVLRAWQLDSSATRDMMARMSVEGLAAMAFEDTVEKRVHRVDDVRYMFEESRIGDSSRKVGIKAYPGGGHVMFVEQPRI